MPAQGIRGLFMASTSFRGQSNILTSFASSLKSQIFSSLVNLFYIFIITFLEKKKTLRSSSSSFYEQLKCLHRFMRFHMFANCSCRLGAGNFWRISLKLDENEKWNTSSSDFMRKPVGSTFGGWLRAGIWNRQLLVDGKTLLVAASVFVLISSNKSEHLFSTKCVFYSFIAAARNQFCDPRQSSLGRNDLIFTSSILFSQLPITHFCILFASKLNFHGMISNR